MRKIHAVDLFCGAGGTSTGLALACEEAGVTIDLLAVNHWTKAIETHEKNHPWARHLCKSLHEVNPKEAVPGGKIDLLIAAPECTHHSVARGGRPINDQMRMSAWQIVDWLSALRVRNLLIENVREFRDWGPLNAAGRPIKRMKGETYRAFTAAIRSLGYRIEERILNAADYGDPTTRGRLFIVGRLGNQKIDWPLPTHDETGMHAARWRAAREIIDWKIPSGSIFTRQKPLSQNTLSRIAAGLKRFGGVSFIVNSGGPKLPPKSTDQALGTILTRNHRALVEPFLVNLRGTRPRHVSETHSVDKPVPTLSTNGHVGVVEPFIVPHRMFDRMDIDSIDRPLRTITATNGRCHALCEPFLVPFFGERDGQKPRTHSVDDPLPAVTSHGAGGLVESFLIAYRGNHDGRQDGDRRAHSLEKPLPTQDCSNRYGLVEPYLVTVNHGDGSDRRSHSIDKPAPTLTSKCGIGLVEAFLVQYNGTAGARSVDKPVPTLTAKDRFGLVEYPLVKIKGEMFALDVRFRMLKWWELARAMGFPASYEFAGNIGEIVRQIGNAVAVNQAKALCGALLGLKRMGREDDQIKAAG